MVSSICAICLLTTNVVNTASHSEKFVRIAILKGVKKCMLQVRGGFNIVNPLTKEILFKGRVLRKTKVLVSELGIEVGRQVYVFNRIRIVPKKEATIYVDTHRLRGEIDLIRDNQQHLMVVNRLEVEKYIKGVLYHEVSPRWPIEALKAQAVAARSYALYQIKECVTKNYDLSGDIYSQVYGGRSSERYRTNIAVNRTKGLVLGHNNEFFPSYYHATCAGHTEDVRQLWEQDLSPLKGIECNFCVKSPHCSWKKNLRLKNIQSKLNQNGFNLGLIKEIEVLERNNSNRIKELQITTRNDKTVVISGKGFRNIIGPNVIKSNNYEIDMKGYYVDFIGKGWGHGVGMCQWGAFEMARQRFKYDEILKHYYPGTRVINYRELEH